MPACLLLAVGLPIDPRGGALQEHAHQMMPDVDLLDIASSGRPVRDASCRAVGALDGRALQLHTLALLDLAVLLPTALPDRVLQRLLVSRMAAWEAVDALERSRVVEEVGLREGTLKQRLGLGLYHPRLDLATPEGGHIQAGQRRRGGDGGWSRSGSGSVGRRSGSFGRRLTRRWNSLAKGGGWALVTALRLERRCYRLFGVAHRRDPLRGRFLFL